MKQLFCQGKNKTKLFESTSLFVITLPPLLRDSGVGVTRG